MDPTRADLYRRLDAAQRPRLDIWVDPVRIGSSAVDYMEDFTQWKADCRALLLKMAKERKWAA